MKMNTNFKHCGFKKTEIKKKLPKYRGGERRRRGENGRAD